MIQLLCIFIFATLEILLAQDYEGPEPEFSSKVDPALDKRLKTGETPKVLVTFAEGTKQTLARVSSLRFQDPGLKSTAIYEALLDNADKSQDNVERLLSTRRDGNNVHFQKFWITNQMIVQGADMKTIREIAENPEVSGIKEEPVKELFDLAEENILEPREGVPRPPDGHIQWNIAKIQAPAAWEELGHQGEGAVVGIIDSGAHHTHEVLRDNFLGDYGWFDPFRGREEPYDDNWHGSEVTSLAVGGRGIGVAPGAKWAHCKGCGFDCHMEDLLACGEFFACPTLANGTGRDCTKSPRVLVNSWGGSFDEESDALIATWSALGIIPVFAIGNSGTDNQCSTTTFPGRHADVIGVGSVNSENTTNGTDSSLGPVGRDENERIKPDVVAPGEDIVVGVSGNDTRYGLNSGTSFACPHVAGVIALLLSRDKDLTIAEVKEILFNSTDRDNMQFPPMPPFPFKWQCDSVVDGVLVWPNNHYGHGLVNAYKAVKTHSSMLTKQTK